MDINEMIEDAARIYNVDESYAAEQIAKYIDAGDVPFGDMTQAQVDEMLDELFEDVDQD